MIPKTADGMANSVDPDQTVPLGAVWSGSTLFAQVYLPENFQQANLLDVGPKAAELFLFDWGIPDGKSMLIP